MHVQNEKAKVWVYAVPGKKMRDMLNKYMPSKVTLLRIDAKRKGRDIDALN